MAIRIQRNPKAVWRAIRAYGSQDKMAEALSVTQVMVSQWALGSKPVSFPQCVKIERDTRRIAQARRDPTIIVTCEELQPGMDWEAVLQLAMLRLANGAPA